MIRVMKDGSYSVRAPKEYIEEAMELTGAKNVSDLFVILLTEKLGVVNQCKTYERKNATANKKINKAS